MDCSDGFAWEHLDQLITAEGPASVSWFSRVHRYLVAAFPGRSAFRLREDVSELDRWLQAKGIPREDHVLRDLIFDTDRDGARSEPENGWVRFTWNAEQYDCVAFTMSEDSGIYTYAWIVCSGLPAAHALANELGRHAERASSGVLVFRNGSWDDAPRVAKELAAYSWDSVVLPETARERLRRTTEVFFRSGPVYQELGIPWKLGFLFVGPPGTGKTLSTKILAATCGANFLYVRSFARKWGRDANQDTVRDLFEGARKYAPCILCLEDVDSLIRDDLRSTFLNELDGLEDDYRGVLTVATTNHPDKLDAALLHRPSRFDYRFEFPLPDDGQRRAFILHWAEKLARLAYIPSSGLDVEELVRRSKGMSQAYLKRVMVGVIMRMQVEELRGEDAFQRIALEELSDAQSDRKVGKRAEKAELSSNVARVGFHLD
jgi:hypothetical protein